MSGVHVTVEVAQVYRAAGRRFFTKAAAYHAAARTLINKRCECYDGTFYDDDASDHCRYHAYDASGYSAHGKRVIARLIRRWKRRAGGDTTQVGEG